MGVPITTALVVLALQGLALADPLSDPTHAYVVKKGDTLTGIAKDYLGSSERYKELAELNKLKVNTVDGIDYVRLNVGQIIELPLTEEGALERSLALIVERIEKVRGTNLRTPPSYPPGLHITINREGKTEIVGRNTHLTLANLSHIRQVLEWYSLWDFAFATRNAAYERAQTPKQIIDYTKALLALAEQESSYRNIPGRDGEYGWWQMKPSTAVLLDDSVDLSQAEWLLQNDPQWTADRVLDHLLWGKKKSGSWEGAFTFYNGGPKNKHLDESYSDQVMNRLKRF
jgi:hypothetical protein